MNIMPCGSKYKTAQELWAAILKTFGGNEATKKTKKNLLKQQYGNFKVEGSETLEQTFNRLKVIVSQLQFIDVEIKQDDLNQKFLTSLAPEWLMHTIVWRNRSDLDTMSLDDLYNHLKVYESEVQKKLEPNSQNMSFISSAKHSSGNEEVNIASGSTASTNVSTASANIRIDEDDMEEIDIKWNMALLSMRADRQGSKVEEQTLKALMAIDGVGWDWSYMANDEENLALIADEETPIEFALMAKTSAESEVFDNSLCSKACKKNSDILNSKITEITDKLYNAKNMIYHYKLALAHVEARLAKHRNQELKYCEKIRVLEFKTESSTDCIENLKKELEIIKKEKEGLDSKLACFQIASKDLDSYLESQRFDKNKEGLGYCVVPPPPAQVYSPPKKDLSWTNPSEASPSTISPKSFIKFVKENNTPTKSKTDKVETTKKPPVNYAKQYRIPTKKPNVRGNQRNWNNLKSYQLGYWDSGCSRHMTSNISYLFDYEPFDGGYVSFGQGGCKITGKRTIKTGKLEFENMYFVKDLKYNLFSVSQICDNKKSVLFTYSECIVLGRNFKLLDDANVLLRTARQHNMYSIDLNNIVPHKGLTCLVAKASADEGMLWHRRLGHLNFKTMNRLVRHNLVRGLPSKCFENDHTCSACPKGKQHKASCKSKLVNSVTKPLHTLHMDLFGPTSVRSISHKWYCLVVTDDFSRFTCTLFLKTKDETSDILRKFITEIKNLKDLKVKIIRCHVMILNTLDHLGKFEAKGDEGTNSTNLSGIKDAASQEVKNDVSSLRYIALLNWVHDALLESSSSKPQDDCNTDVPKSSRNSNPIATSTNPSTDQIETLIVETPIPTVGSPVPTACFTDSQEPSSDTRFISKRVANQVETPSLDNILTLTNRFEDILRVTTNSDESNGVEADVRNLETTITPSPTPTLRIHKDHPKSQIIGHVDTLIQTRNKSKETLVDCPKGVRPIGTKWVLKNKKDERGIVIRNKARLVAQGHTQEERIDYDEVFAPVARIEAIRLFLAYASFMGFTVYQMDVKSAFLYHTIDEEVEFKFLMHGKFQMSAMGELNFFLGLQVLQKEDGIFLSQDKTGKDVDLHLYRSMIGSLMYLTASRPDIMFAICACAKHQVTPKECHLHAVKRIFRYLKGGATQDRKSTTGGCQFLGRRLISWQCKKQTIVATSTAKAEYVTAASCCGQVLWIQNQLLDYGLSMPCEALSREISSSILRFNKIMARLQFCDYHNMVAILEKSEHNVDFHPIVDFVKASPLRRARIAQSSALPPIADEPAFPLRDVSQGDACHTVSSLDAEQDRANIAKTSTLPHESTSRVTSLAADEGSMQHKLDELTVLCTSLQRKQSKMVSRFEAQELEINSLKVKIKLLEDKDRGVAEHFGNDARIKGRRLDVGEKASKRVSDDTVEMATVLTSMDTTTVLASGVAEVHTGNGSIPTASPPAAEVPTSSDVVPTAGSHRRTEKLLEDHKAGRQLSQLPIFYGLIEAFEQGGFERVMGLSEGVSQHQASLK
nr:ribonuclease H-like domain-containing protein [Tanacetum cinerariifolium]